MSNDRKIYIERNRKWGFKSVFLVGWVCNAIDYCDTPEGRREFETWIRLSYPENAPAVLADCDAAPKPFRSNPGGNLDMWNKAAVDLGISTRGILLRHQFCTEKRVAEPARTLPAAIKRKGESSCAWIMPMECPDNIPLGTRLNFFLFAEERLKGAKNPPIDWDEMRRIAFSEFDFVRDQMKVWRTRPDIFFDGLLQRAASTILHPGVPEEEQFSQSCMDAMRSRIHLAHIQYAAWFQATTLFGDLDKIGLRTANQVMDAFRADPHLLGRIVSVFTYVNQVLRWFSGKFNQVLTSGEYLRPYFIRERINKSAVISPNREYLKSHPLASGTIEHILVSLFSNDVSDNRAVSVSAKISYLIPVLQTARERAKITAEAYDAIGDLAVLSEFTEGFLHSSFGEALRDAVAEADRTGTSKAWFSILSLISREKLRVDIEPPNLRSDQFIQHDWIVKGVVNTWLCCIFGLEGRPYIDKLIKTKYYEGTFDYMWMNLDQLLESEAAKIERAPGLLKKFFGLVGPFDSSRPVHSTEYLGAVFNRQEDQRTFEVSEAPQAVDDTSAIPSIPIATPQDSIARAPARSQPNKKKTRGQAKPTPTGQERPQAGRVDEDAPRSLLPTTKKLSRFNKEIFERILSNEEKSGQIRWGDFEKAMAQLGFEIVQTEGSSVRFDSPIRGARPITFHRPHPDSTMNPSMIKWVGARLRRCYGWVATDFVPLAGSTS